MPRHGTQRWFKGEVIWVPDRSYSLQKVSQETKERECLKCHKLFTSYSKCHRLCDYCHACNQFEYQSFIVILKGTRVERRF